MPTGPLPTSSPSCPFIPNLMTPWWCKVTRKMMWTLLTAFISFEGQEKSLQQDQRHPPPPPPKKMLPEQLEREWKLAPHGHLHLNILGDGNCFPQTLKVLISGTENHHVVMRVRGRYHKEKKRFPLKLWPETATKTTSSQLVFYTQSTSAVISGW